MKLVVQKIEEECDYTFHKGHEMQWHFNKKKVDNYIQHPGQVEEVTITH